MNKIIRIEDKQDSLVNYIKKILDMAEKGEIEKIMIASFMKNKVEDCCVPETLTGYYDLCELEKQYLISSLQTDLSYNVVKANVDDLIEIINE
jgi:hypothetical protein